MQPKSKRSRSFWTTAIALGIVVLIAGLVGVNPWLIAIVVGVSLVAILLANSSGYSGNP